MRLSLGATMIGEITPYGGWGSGLGGRGRVLWAGQGRALAGGAPTPPLPAPEAAAPDPPPSVWGSAPLPHNAAPRLVLNRRTGSKSTALPAPGLPGAPPLSPASPLRASSSNAGRAGMPSPAAVGCPAADNGAQRRFQPVRRLRTRPEADGRVGGWGTRRQPATAGRGTRSQPVRRLRTRPEAGEGAGGWGDVPTAARRRDVGRSQPVRRLRDKAGGRWRAGGWGRPCGGGGGARSAGEVPHSDTGPRIRRGSATLRGIMRYGLLLLSRRGEGL